MRFGNIKLCRGTIISLIGGGVLGALSGGLAGYLVNKMIYKKKIDGYIYDWYKQYEESIDADYEDEDTIDLEDDDGVYAEINPLKESDELKEKIFKECRDRLEPYVTFDNEEETKSEIQNIFDVVDSDAEDALARAEEFGGQPYVISYEDYFESCTDFVKTTIGWYPKERILADENNEPIPEDEWSDWVGDDGLNMFGQGPSHDGDVVFIRNPYTHHDYEVIRFSHETYSEEDTVGEMNE